MKVGQILGSHQNSNIFLKLKYFFPKFNKFAKTWDTSICFSNFGHFTSCLFNVRFQISVLYEDVRKIASNVVNRNVKKNINKLNS